MHIESLDEPETGAVTAFNKALSIISRLEERTRQYIAEKGTSRGLRETDISEYQLMTVGQFSRMIDRLKDLGDKLNKQTTVLETKLSTQFTQLQKLREATTKRGEDINNMSEALQAKLASLGGLKFLDKIMLLFGLGVGAIILIKVLDVMD